MTDFPITLPADDPLAVEALENEDRQEALEKALHELVNATIAVKMSISRAKRAWWVKVGERFDIDTKAITFSAAISPRGVTITPEREGED